MKKTKKAKKKKRKNKKAKKKTKKNPGEDRAKQDRSESHAVCMKCARRPDEP